MEHEISSPGCSVPQPPTGTRPAERLYPDESSLRQASYLRLFAAAVAALGGVWLYVVTDSLVLRGTALVSVLFALVWSRTQLRALRTPSPHDDSARDYLEIGEHHLAVRDQGSARSVPLCEVRRVWVDDDRLLVVLDLDAGPWTIEPRYPGVGLHDLAERIHLAVVGALPAGEDARG